MPLRDWPIRKKLMAILLAISAFVLLLTSAAFLAFEVLTFRRTAREGLSTLGRVIAANSTASLAFADVGDATEILSALRAEPHVTAAALYDEGGRLFARYPPDLPGEALPAALAADGYRFERGRLVGFEPVAQSSRSRLGTLYLESSLEALYDTLWLSALIGAAVFAFSLLAAYAVARVLQGRISEPILALTETAAAVSTRRDYSVRAPKLAADEIGALTDAFNQMLARIEEQDRTVQGYAAELEQRVEQRTLELQERNEALQRNTAELLAVNEELYAFAYSVSHDLRAPLRTIDGFSQVLLEDYTPRLDEAGQDSLRRVRAATQRMGTLIDDLL
ncbi:MAG: sensor histidine kinase, partial [Gemmatimonadota bacterium]